MIDLNVRTTKPEGFTRHRLGCLLIAATLPLMAGSSAAAQSAVTTGTNFVTSSFNVGQVVVGSQVFTSVSISVVYNAGLGASQYIPAAQLTSQVTSAFGAYPTPGDPPEAIGSAVGQAILAQNPQINGLSLVVDQITVPTGVPIGGNLTSNTFVIVLGTQGSAAAQATTRKAGQVATSHPPK